MVGSNTNIDNSINRYTVDTTPATTYGCPLNWNIDDENGVTCIYVIYKYYIFICKSLISLIISICLD